MKSKHPDYFHYNSFGTTIDYKYNVYKFRDHTIEELEQSDNLFTIVNTAGKYENKFKKDIDLGCAINGLPTIRFVKEIEPSFKKVDNPSYPTYVDEEFRIYFEQDLTLDYMNGMFKLSSAGEILNAFISESSINKDRK